MDPTRETPAPSYTSNTPPRPGYPEEPHGVRKFLNKFKRNKEIPVAGKRAEATPTTLPADVHEVTVLNFDTGAYGQAAKMAQEHIADEQRRGSMFNPRNWARKTGLRIFEEYYRQNNIRDAVAAMRTNNNVFISSTEIFRNAAVTAAERAAQEQLQQGTIQAQINIVKRGELIYGQDVRQASDIVKSALATEVLRPIISGFQTGAPLDAGQIRERLQTFVANHQDDRDVQELFGRDATRYRTLTEFFASDIADMGRNIEQDIAAGKYRLDQIDQHISLKLGNVNWGGEDQLRWSMADKAVAWAEGSKLKGRFFNPAVIGAVTSIVGYGGMRAASYSGKGLLAATTLAPGAGFVGGFITSAARRFHEVKMDRTSVNLANTLSEQAGPNANRRRRLERFSVDKVATQTLLEGGARNRPTLSGDERGIQQLLAADASLPSTQNAILDRIAEIKARLDYGARAERGFTRYEGTGRVEAGRTGQNVLLLDVVLARQKLRDAGMSEDEIAERENRNYGQWYNRLDRDKSHQDFRFNVYRLGAAAWSGAIGGAVGLTGGFVLKETLQHVVPQEAWSALGVKKLSEKAQDLKHLFKDNNKKPVQVGDLRLAADQNHNVSITLPDGRVVHENISLNDQGRMAMSGTLDPQVKEQLTINGFKVVEKPDAKLREILSPNTPLNTGADTDNIGGHVFYTPKGTGWWQDETDPTKWNLVPDGDPNTHLIQGLYFKPDGSFDYNHDVGPGGSLMQGDFLNSRLVEVQAPHIQQETVLGENGLWPKNATAIDHREWYAYNTPYSDYNELRAYNSVFTTADGQKGVVWDMSHMTLSYQRGLNPNPIDVQQVIHNGQAGFAFSRFDDQGHPIWVSDLSDGVADGKIRLDPSDFIHHIDPNNPNSMTVGEFSKIILNQDKLHGIPDGSLASELTHREDVFNLGQDGKNGFIEAGRMVDTDKGKTLQAFATGRGASPTPATIGINVPGQYQNVIDILPQQVNVIDHATFTDIDPPGSHFEAPFIPFPFMSPRFPIEPTVPGEPPPPPPPPPVEPPPPYGGYGYYGGTGRPTREAIGSLDINTTELEAARDVMPDLLPPAFARWGISDDEKRLLGALEIPEQLEWLRNKLINMDKPTHSDGTLLTKEEFTVDKILELLGVEKKEVPSEAETETSEENLTLFLADEVNSPIYGGTIPERSANMRTAIADMQEFISLGDIEQAALKGGIDKKQALEIYKNMITWKAKNNIIDIEKEDPGFSDNPIYNQLFETSNDYLWVPDDVEARAKASALMHFYNSGLLSTDIFSRGDTRANIFVLLAAYERLRDLPLRA